MSTQTKEDINHKIGHCIDIDRNVATIHGNIVQIMYPKYGKNIKQHIKYYKDNGLDVVIHGNYTINLCHNKDSYKLGWNMKLLINSLNDSIDTLGLIIHMGKNVEEINIDDNQAIKNFVHNMKTALEQSSDKSTLILETGAGVGTEVCSKLSGLGLLRALLPKRLQSRVKFCLDTCHMYSVCYDYSRPMLFDINVDMCLGWENVICCHFNDSKEPYKSRKDSHADIMNGYIKSKLKPIAKLMHKYNIPMILETKEEVHNNIKSTFEIQMDIIKLWIK